MARLRTLGLVPLGIVAIAFFVAVAGSPLFVFPHIDTPQQSDAVVVLGAPMVQRLVVAQKIVDDGDAPVMYISVPANWESGDTPRLLRLCRNETTIKVTCFTPDPFTTEGEAIAVKRFASENGWQTVTVVTSVPHISRARYIFSKCEGDLAVGFVQDDRDLSPGDWIYEYAYQTGGFLKALFQQGC